MTLPTSMRYVAIREPGPPDVLVPAEGPLPQVKPGEVLIHVTYAGVNRPDCLQRSGAYPPPPDASPIVGLEVAGRIVALGDGATEKRTRARVVREPSARASALADRLIERLDTRVNVVMGAKGKGRIVIDFAGDEDLERLAELLGDL